MAPEQFQGQVSKESDQYALACIAYELFTGHTPFEAPDFISMGFKHGTQPPMALTHFNPHVPAYIEQAILKAMAKQRSERYPDVATFLAALTSPPLAQATLPPVLQEEDIPTFLSSRPPAANLPQSLPEEDIPTFLSSRPPTAAHPPQVPEGLKAPSSPLQASPPPAPAIGVLPSTPMVRPVRRRGVTRGGAALLIGMVFLVIAGSVFFFATHPNTPAPGNTPTATTLVSTPVNAPMFGFDPQHTHFNPDEHLLSPTNVSRLVLYWTSSTGAIIDSSPAVANGVVYVGSYDGKLYAFAASGCDQSSCMPLWTATIGNLIFSEPAVVNSVVYVGSLDHKLYAFNASGCGQSSCTPLWTASAGNAISYSSPAVVNGVVYVGSHDGKLYAFHLPGTGS